MFYGVKNNKTVGNNDFKLLSEEEKDE